MPTSVTNEHPAGFPGGPRLLADVGGTNARFALELAPGNIGYVHVLPCAAYATLAAALRAYLGLPDVAAVAPVVRHGAIAIANPVAGDVVRMTNHHWQFSIAQLREECGFEVLAVVNDFTALARALPYLDLGEEKRQVGGRGAEPGTPLAVIGPGTGLGVSALIPTAAGWTALQSEGGHASFSPINETEVEILRFARREFGHVSAERLISGSGIELVYRALADLHGVPAEPLSAADVTLRALRGNCLLCDETIESFCGMLGTVAGNLAVTLGARGGVYIGGGIVPKLGERFDRSLFRARFEGKGRFNAYLSAIPTYVITAGYPAFAGVSAILAERLGDR
ncbi:glucokinase [Pseudoduganella umbonata]|nr:glucokinase [Pseudoduganella umbonata]